MQLCGPGRVKGASGGIPTQSACAWVRVFVCVCVTLTQCWRKFSCRHADRDTCCVLTRELFVIFGIKTGVCVQDSVRVWGPVCVRPAPVCRSRCRIRCWCCERGRARGSAQVNSERFVRLCVTARYKTFVWVTWCFFSPLNWCVCVRGRGHR